MRATVRPSPQNHKQQEKEDKNKDTEKSATKEVDVVIHQEPASKREAASPAAATDVKKPGGLGVSKSCPDA